jgi:LysR family transcriptional regulator, regulator for bpeEF and oprC
MDRLWAMEVFVRVADCGSFSRAAESMGLANATVTACVRNLERHLNVSLIGRNSRGLRLSEEGALFLPRARELLASLSHAEDEVRIQRSALRGSLRIEATIHVGRTVLSPLLPKFVSRYPDIAVSVTLTNQPHNLIERGIDVAIRFGRVEEADLVARSLFEVHYVICGRPDIVKSLPDDPSDLDPRQCIGLMPEEVNQPFVWQMEQGERKVLIQPKGRLNFNSGDMALVAAQGGAGLAYVLDIFAKPYLDSGAVVQAYEDWMLPARTFYVVTTKDRSTSAKVRAFSDFLFEELDPDRQRSRHLAINVKALHKR